MSAATASARGRAGDGGRGPVFVRELTARAPGGVAVLEATGAGARAAVERLTGRALPAVGGLALARLVEGDDVLDEALVAPLADDGVELWLHGSPAVVARVRRALGGAAANPPTTWAEVARERLVDVAGDAGARVLLDQSAGALDEALDDLGRPGDDGARLARADALLAAGRAAAPYLVPPLVVLTGPVNAGKSTLFNLLVGHDRALATEVPGTTRDAVRERGRDGDLVVEFADTAGERATWDAGEDGQAQVERAGQELARRLVERADLELVCVPPDAATAGVAPVVRPRTPQLLVHTRGAASAPGAQTEAGALAVRVLEDPVAARRDLWRGLRRALDAAAEPWTPGRAVPFDPALLAALADLRARGAEALGTRAAAGGLAPAALGVALRAVAKDEVAPGG